MYRSIIRPLLFKIDPEKVHDLLICWLKIYKYCFPIRMAVQGHCTVISPLSFDKLSFKNRIGLSAGFDKNGECYNQLADFGFGFIEIGTVTPDPQRGNPKPRVFRLVEDKSLISRTGFNNDGVEAVAKRLRRKRNQYFTLGVNINKNPNSVGEQVVKDFIRLYISLSQNVDYFTVNWGSLTPDEFKEAIRTLSFLRDKENEKKGIFIKLPADIDFDTLDEVIAIGEKYKVEGYIATGPTMDRSDLKYVSTDELNKIGAGGVSGAGLTKKSLDVVRYLAKIKQRDFLIIGAGGIMTPSDAKEMIASGADLIQLYSAMIYSGPFIVHKIGKKISRH